MNPRGKTKSHWFYHPHTQALLYWVGMGLGVFIVGICLYYGLKTDSHHPSVSMDIERPDFYSISPSGHPYHIHSQSIQYGKSGQFAFFQPWATYHLQRQNLTLRSHMGYWDDALQQLTLKQKVHIHDTQGNHIHSAFMQVLYEKKEIKSHTITTGAGPRGTFQSQGFSWTEKALHLHGPVTLRVRSLGPDVKKQSKHRSEKNG